MSRKRAKRFPIGTCSKILIWSDKRSRRQASNEGTRRLRVRRSEATTLSAAIRRDERRAGRGTFDPRLCGACVLALCWPAQAQAHDVVKTLGAFWAGVVHPLISPDQLGVLLALAIWIVWRPRRGEVFLAVLPLGAFLGAWLAPSGAPFPLLTPAAIAFFGVMAAARLNRASLWGECLAAAFGGASVGIASAAGAEDASRGLFALGVALSVASVTAYALLAARQAVAMPPWMEAGARGGAGVIALLGIGLFTASAISWLKP
jgi:urease accessory protein